jgi:hypothetical protein
VCQQNDRLFLEVIRRVAQGVHVAIGHARDKLIFCHAGCAQDFHHKVAEMAVKAAFDLLAFILSKLRERAA